MKVKGKIIKRGQRNLSKLRWGVCSPLAWRMEICSRSNNPEMDNCQSDTSYDISCQVLPFYMKVSAAPYRKLTTTLPYTTQQVDWAAVSQPDQIRT